MAYSISGFIFDQYNNPVPNCYYQFLFLKVDSFSSPTTWSEVKQADQFGYYSADILDGSLIGTDGTYNTYDEVLVACWIGDSTRSISITEYADWVSPIVDTNKEITIQDIKIYPVQAPVANYDGLPSEGIVDTSYNLINTSTASWAIAEGPHWNTSFYQHCEYRDETIFLGTCIEESKWEYGLGPDDLYPGKHDTDHSWNTPGVYDVTLTVTNYAGLSDSYTEQIIIRYLVVVDFDYTPDPPHIEDPVNFTNESSDPWSRVTKYRWEFYDGDILAPPTNTYEGPYSLSPTYIFSNHPDRCVTLTAFWNDGIEDQESSKTECLGFIPIADFEKIDAVCSPIYRDRSIPGLSPKIYYWWSVRKETETGWKEFLALEGPEAIEIQFHFPHTGTFQIWHKVEDSNNLTDEIIKEYEITVCPCAGGGGRYYNYPGGRQPQIPDIWAKLLKIEEKRKVKLKLKLVKTESKKL